MMNERNGGNKPQSPNQAEKTRTGVAPNLPSDSEQPETPMQTRFGMIPPTLTHTPTHTLKTGQFRFDGTQNIEADLTVRMHFLEMYAEPQLSRDSNEKGQRSGSFFYALFLRTLKIGGLLSMFFVLLGLGFYFIFYDSIHPRQTAAPPFSEAVSLSTPSTTIRFFDLIVPGRRFVFLIDATESMGESMGPQADSLAFSLMKNKLQQSLQDLREFHFFEFVDFTSRISTAFGQNGAAMLVPADMAHLSTAWERIEAIQPRGNHDLKSVILTALASKPDAILFVCHTTNAAQLNSQVLAEIESAADGTRLYAVEIADTIRPFGATPLEKLANDLNGGYQWLRIQGMEQDMEYTPDSPLAAQIDADFRSYDDISRPDTQNLSPFGKEIIIGSNRSADGDGSLTPPKPLAISNAEIHEIETDARIVYMSGLTETPNAPQNPSMLPVGAESRMGLWLRGAKAELPAAEYLIGLCYKNGVRVTPDADKAFQCQLKAARQGCLPSMLLVAMEYKARSDADPSNPSELGNAKDWAKKAADLGEPQARYFWANHFASTPEERLFWLQQAAEQGLPAAKTALEQLQMD